MMADSLGACERDTILPVVPMFHANAWGLAHAGVACGANLIMPGPDLSPTAIANLIEHEKVTVAAGVPTIWMGVLPELKGRDTSHLRAIPCGGSAVPRHLSEAYRETTGLPIMQAWGMTETSPVASVGRLKSYLADSLSEEEQADLRTSDRHDRHRRRLPGGRPGRSSRSPWDGDAPGRAAGHRAVDRPRVLQRPPLARLVHRGRLPARPATSSPSTRRATSASSTAPRTW